MNRVMVGLVAAATMVVPAAAQADQDSVTGGGGINIAGLFQAHVDISAQSAPNGTDPTGTATAHSKVAGVPITFGGRVTCMRVQGNRAVIKYAFDSASPSILKGGGIEVFIKDEPTGQADKIGFLPPQDPITWKLTQPNRCDPFDLDPFQTQEGDFTVTDAH